MDSRKFGRYEIHGKLGRGAMGVVYKAFDPMLQRSLAIKVMSSGTDEEAVERFFREARATAGLRHPNIVAVYDIGEEDSQPYIAIEYLDGQDLGQFLKQDLFIPFVWKIHLIIDICRGLHHAHQQGVIHRDIKPSNIRITRSGEVKIVDFGVAKLKSSEMTATGMVVGTPSYMSPQQVQGVKELDGRSDIFSAGVLLFELITGRKPFAAPELHAVMFQICNTPHTPLTEALPGCSEELSAIVDRALAKDTDDRFQSGDEMANALEHFLKQLNGACKSLQQEFDRKAEELRERCSRLEEEGLSDLVPRQLQQVPPPAFDPDQTILQDFGLFQAAGQQGADYGELLQRSAALNRRLDDLDRARKGLKEVRQWYSQSRQQFDSGLWEPCLASLEAILEKHSDFAPALELKKECQARLKQQEVEKEKKSRLDDLLKQARAARKSEEVQQAQDLAQELLKLDAGHAEAASILEWAEQLAQRQAELEGHLAQAQSCAEKGDHQGCLEAARSGLEIAPGHPELSRLHEQSQQVLEKQHKAEELLSQARSRLKANELEACLEAVEKGLKQSPGHEALQQLKAQAESELKRRQQVSELYEKAQSEYQAGKFSQAIKSAQSVLDLDSEHQQAQQLAEQASKALDVQQQIALLIEQARSQLESGNAEACLQTVGQGLKLESENEPLKELKQQAEAELKTHRQADQELAAARQKAQAKDFLSALSHLEKALELKPGWQEAAELEAKLKDALASQQRFEKLLAQSRKQEDSGELQQALASADEGLQIEPDHSGLLELRQRVQLGIERQQEIRSLLEQAEQELAEKDYSSALQSLQSLAELHSDHPRIEALQKAARQGLEEDERVEELLARARSQAKEGDFQGCLQSASQGLEVRPGHSPFEKLRDQAQQELDKRQTVGEGLEQARKKLDKGEFQAALSQLEQLLKLDGGNAQARQMLSQARQALDVREQLELHIQQARSQLEAEDLEACLESVRQGLELEGKNEQLTQLKQQAEARLRTRRQADQALAAARQKVQADDLQGALNHLERALQLSPGWQEATQLQDELKATLGRQQLLEKLLAQARRQEESSDLKAALSSAEEGLQIEPGHSGLLELRQRVQQNLKRQQEIQSLLDRAEKQLQEKDYSAALQSVESLSALQADHPRIKTLQKAAQQGLKDIERGKELLAQARAQAKQGDFEGCLQSASQGLEILPENAELQKLRQQAQQELDQRRAEVLLLEAKRLEEKEELQPALQTAAKALQIVPRHEELQQLHSRLQQRVEEIRQQEEREAKIRQGLLEARLAFQKKRLRAAQQALAPVLKLAPDLEEAQQLGKKVQVARQKQQAQLRKGGLGAAAAVTLALAGYLLWPTASVDGPSSSPTWVSYQLKAGDTLQSAAALLGVDAEQLISSNHLDGSENVFPGQVLQSSPPQDPGTLVLNISPWASVDALIRQDGTRVLEGASLTPLRIDLAPGEYTVQASNPELGGEGMEFKVTIQAGEVNREFRKWPHVDLERELNRLFLSRAASAEGTN